MGVTCVTGYTEVGSCAPECVGKDDGTAVKDPKDCYYYYVCKNEAPNDIALSCSDGQYFNENLLKCVDGECPYSYYCIPVCNFEPHRGDGFLAHRTDCSKYYDYDGVGTATEQDCPTGHYFNGVDCSSTDVNDCCDPCLVFCDVANVYIADPLDCTKYYHCNKDYSFPETSIPCVPEDFKYNFLSGECTATSSCTQLCSKVPIDPDSTTTTTPSPVDCFESWTCTMMGFFPVCPNFCSPNYFRCDGNNIWGPGEIDSCLVGQVVNPDTDPLRCVPLDDCPYPYHP